MRMKENIIEKKLIDELRNNILGSEDEEMGFLVRLRDGEGLDKKKLENTYIILDEMIRIYDNYNQIDKKVIELIMNIPRDMNSFIEWNPGCKDDIETAMVKFLRYISRILKTE
ncbi:hypothetical protein B0P06_000547 [Clostridium saccharoperbutylacetonicum]|uniref:Uncharacterized protein n=2 Tax=Clostridium saccharoperbutylacetonicum TaxID=36745 RepID=M1MBQ7_9CLOT|nr:hypothetical protein [Clostridium saccharoperbutylacetonicum]AGF55364.1 hypothetical protein Cspa_c15940 [Clostridium saccharoperbutylacetonicum N1-4(HMT)]NRT63923.1 hypothetical protein [Clostridium saccharoperbutylacetonicum]NSB27290.1 hypothetical protein [Clostridium saccharoperbutylacetonicum]NSB40776.1 hypothetical protein [Clostridium saccharoperbutylacetonicum]